MLFFVLSKMLAFLIKPHLWVLALFLMGLYQLFRGKPENAATTKAKKYLIGAFFIAYITGNHPIVNELYVAWEAKHATPRLHQTNTYPRTAIILSGYSLYDIESDIFRTTEAGDRMMVGLEGVLNNKFDRIILTGGSSSVFNKIYYEAEQVSRYLQRFGVDSSKIIVDNDSRNTYENAVICKRIIDSLQIKEPVLLVTSAAHMYRSRKCFQKAGVNFIEYPAHKIGSTTRRYNFEAWVIPNPGSMSRFGDLLHEIVGVVAYKLSGKI